MREHAPVLHHEHARAHDAVVTRIRVERADEARPTLGRLGTRGGHGERRCEQSEATSISFPHYGVAPSGTRRARGGIPGSSSMIPTEGPRPKRGTPAPPGFTTLTV